MLPFGNGHAPGSRLLLDLTLIPQAKSAPERAFGLPIFPALIPRTLAARTVRVWKEAVAMRPSQCSGAAKFG